ncbi:hypothetical protein [Ligilactobacillus equi]|uniref:Oxidoreductase n=1 Tax=Ligilactobacillus equi DPC 6820 TaxID=1392007 RepID=V7HYW0_9LACO|nr:hypothetical protein [Ligilactobacillus equi]ETA75077.1 oxidoreductase [Ligilactobacillus equi DPC 6820]
MKKHLTWLAWAFFLVLIPTVLIASFNFNYQAPLAKLLAYDLGIIAFVLWVEIAWIKLKPHWVEKTIGVDTLYKVISFLGVIALLGAGLHQMIAESASTLIKTTGIVAWLLALVIAIYGLIALATKIPSRKVKLNRVIKAVVNILAILVVALIWIHVNVIPAIASIRPFMITFNIYAIFAFGCQLFGWYRKRH